MQKTSTSTHRHQQANTISETETPQRLPRGPQRTHPTPGLGPLGKHVAPRGKSAKQSKTKRRRGESARKKRRRKNRARFFAEGWFGLLSWPIAAPSADNVTIREFRSLFAAGVRSSPFPLGGAALRPPLRQGRGWAWKRCRESHQFCCPHSFLIINLS